MKATVQPRTLRWWLLKWYLPMRAPARFKVIIAKTTDAAGAQLYPEAGSGDCHPGIGSSISLQSLPSIKKSMVISPQTRTYSIRRDTIVPIERRSSIGPLPIPAATSSGTSFNPQRGHFPFLIFTILSQMGHLNQALLSLRIKPRKMRNRAG